MLKAPGVGVGIIIRSGDKYLLVKRINVHGEGTWSTPGGHLDFGETFEDCAAREAKEETGLDVSNIRFRALTNDYFESEDKHYVTIWMEGDASDANPEQTAPEEIAELGWFSETELPEPLFLSFSNLMGGSGYPK